MVEIARVLSTQDNKAKLFLKGEESCGTSCSSCKGGSCSATSSIVEAENIVGAEVGQEVMIEMKGDMYLKTAALVYGLPLIIFMIGVGIGPLVTKILGLNISWEIVSTILGLIFWLSSYGFVKLVDNKFKISSMTIYTIVDVI